MTARARAIPAVKVLWLVRHAKSSHGEGPLGDFDRPLNDRGRRDAPVMGGRVAGSGRAPEVVLTSPAIRAFTTARLIAAAIGLAEASVVVVPSLYGAGSTGILEAVLGLGDEMSRAMIVGHNPGMTQLAAELSRGAIDHMPTCAIAAFEFPAARWSELGPGQGRLLSFDTPRPRTT